jgi:branched-subunit amino acid ABC-type transport system permease component
MTLQEAMQLIFTGDYLSVKALIAGFAALFGVRVFYQHLLTLVSVLVILGGLHLFLKKTRLALAAFTGAVIAPLTVVQPHCGCTL